LPGINSHNSFLSLLGLDHNLSSESSHLQNTEINVLSLGDLPRFDQSRMILGDKNGVTLKSRDDGSLIFLIPLELPGQLVQTVIQSLVFGNMPNKPQFEQSKDRIAKMALLITMDNDLPRADNNIE